MLTTGDTGPEPDGILPFSLSTVPPNRSDDNVRSGDPEQPADRRIRLAHVDAG